MQSKHFAVKISKSIVDGQIQLECTARAKVPGYDLAMQNVSAGASGCSCGSRAYIFQLGISGPLRSTRRWGKDAGGQFTDEVRVSFNTGVEASKFIERVRQHLQILDTALDCIQAECDALEVE